MTDRPCPIDCPDDSSSTFLMFDFMALGQGVPNMVRGYVYLCHPKYCSEVLTLWVDRHHAKSCNQIKSRYFPRKLLYIITYFPLLCETGLDTKMEDDILSSSSFQTGAIVIWRKYPTIKRQMNKAGQFQVFLQIIVSI